VFTENAVGARESPREGNFLQRDGVFTDCAGAFVDGRTGVKLAGDHRSNPLTSCPQEKTTPADAGVVPESGTAQS